MISFILTISISALAGAACGYLWARYVWQDRLIELEEQQQVLRRQRLEHHREQFQHSTSRIHRSAEQTAPVAADELKEELEQLRLEMTLLQEDHRLERQMLEEENSRLKAGSVPPPESDIEETDVVFLDDEEHDDSAADASSGDSDEEGSGEADPGEVVFAAADDSEIDSTEEDPGEVAFAATDDSDGSPQPKIDDAILDEVIVAPLVAGPDNLENNDNDKPKSSGPGTKAEIAPVPSDIESLFGAGGQQGAEEDTAFKKDVAPNKQAEPATIPEESAPDTTTLSSITDAHESETTKAPSDADADTGETIEAPLNAAEQDRESEDEALAPTTEEPPTAKTETAAQEENPSFSIHWQSDRPRRQKHPAAKGDRSTSSEAPAAKAKPDSPQAGSEARKAESDVGLPQEDRDIPVFRSLHDMLEASGVDLPGSSSSAGSNASSRAPSADPKRTPVSQSVSQTGPDDQLVQEIVGLDGDSYALLQDLGYANLRRLANLSPNEIRRLAAVFRIPADRVEQDWKPTATAHLNIMSAS